MKAFEITTKTPGRLSRDEMHFYVCVLFGSTGTTLVRLAYTAPDDLAAAEMAREFLSQRVGAARYEVWHRCAPSGGEYLAPTPLAAPLRDGPLLSVVAR